jgi:hypothetical protein
MQKTTPNIEQIAIDIDNLITNYLQTNDIKDFRINTSFHNVPVSFFNNDLNYFKRQNEENQFYLVHTKDIKKFSFTFFSQYLK